MAELLAESVQAGKDLKMSVVNWGEVLYIAARRRGRAAAREIEAAIEALPIDVVDADRDVARQAAIVKAGGGMSYADAFAVALAKLSGAQLVTGDPELLAAEHLVRVKWLAGRRPK